MKILSIGNFGHGWDGSICDEEHIAGALEELGHEVKRLPRGDTIPLTNGEGPPLYDFILVAQWDGYDIEWLHKAKVYFMCPLVYWAFDYQADGQDWHERLIATSDLYLSKRISDRIRYLNWQWLSQDFAPSFLDRYQEPIDHALYELGPIVKKDIDVLFTGSYLDWATERNETIKAVDEKFNLVVHSVNDWPFLQRQPPVMDHDLPQLYARAKIVLSIDHTIEAGYWSDRVAQILCCGGLVLHRYQPMCEIPFKNKIAYFKDVDECLYQINRLLEMAEEDADLCRRVGYEYADEFLRVKNRVEDLLTIVESIL